MIRSRWSTLFMVAMVAGTAPAARAPRRLVPRVERAGMETPASGARRQRGETAGLGQGHGARPATDHGRDARSRPPAPDEKPARSLAPRQDALGRSRREPLRIQSGHRRGRPAPRGGFRGRDRRLEGRAKRWPEGQRHALEFARLMTLDASLVTDAQVAELKAVYGDEKLVAMVLLLAAANFQDRLILGLGVAPEEGGSLPPVDVKFDHKAPAPLVPVRANPADLHGPAEPTKVDDPAWREFDFDALQQGLRDQKAHRRSRAGASVRRSLGPAPRTVIRSPRAPSASGGRWSAWATSPIWPRPGRPARALSARRPSRTGSSRRACSGS